MYPDAFGVAVSGTNVQDVPAWAEQPGEVAAPAPEGRASSVAVARAVAATTRITLMGSRLTSYLLAVSGPVRRAAEDIWQLLPDLSRRHADLCNTARSGRISLRLPRASLVVLRRGRRCRGRGGRGRARRCRRRHRVEGGQQPEARRLPGDGRLGAFRRPAAAHAAGDAAVGEGDLDHTLLVDGDVVEVEQIALAAAAAEGAGQRDAAALHRVVRGRVHRGPGLAAVVGRGDVEVPDPVELVGLVVAAGGRAEEREGGPVPIAGHHLGELGVLDAEGRADVDAAAPRRTLVVRHRDLRVPVAGVVAEVDGAIAPDADRRVGLVLGRAVGHQHLLPGRAVVGRPGEALVLVVVRVEARLVRHVGRTVRRHLDVAVAPAAGGVDADGREG